MKTLHFDSSSESFQLMDHLLYSYGSRPSVYNDLDSVSFLSAGLAGGFITVTEVPYRYDQSIEITDPDITEIYNQVAQDTLWRSGTSIQVIRMNALHQLKSYGTPVLSDATYILYEDSHVSAYVGNVDIDSLVSHLNSHEDIQKWILFTYPTTLCDSRYYIFNITNYARIAFQKYEEDRNEKKRQAMNKVSNRMFRRMFSGPSDS